MMKNITKKILRLIRSLLNYAHYHFIFLRKTQNDFTIKEGRYAIVNIDRILKNDDHGRYFYLLCMYLNRAGFHLVVKTHWRDLIPREFKKLVLEQKYQFVRKCSTPQNTIVLAQQNTPDHIIHLSYGYNVTLNSHKYDTIMPYPMHPSQYKLVVDTDSIERVEKSDRTLKILFSGSSFSKYQRIKVNKFFKVLSRLEVIEFISSHCHKTIVLKKNNDGALTLEQMLNSKEYFNKVIINEAKTEMEDWLKILSKANFFICPPGMIMPWCHNSVEAMSVGAIPILEYSDLFYPNLEHMKNCIRFTTYEELRTAIETALAMEQSEIEKMRKNVLKYYNDYLSLECIVKKIKTFSTSTQQELKVGIPFISSAEEWEAIKHLNYLGDIPK